MKSTRIKTLIFTIGLALFTINISTAQSRERQERKGPPSYEQLLKEMDANEDGKLSKKEIKGPLKDDFAKIDLDKDGFISEEEFKKAPKPNRRGRKQEN